MVTIPARFNGPDTSGNGGYCCGLLADESGGPGPVTATLRQPPPLGSPLTWERGGDVLRLLTPGGAVVGDAVAGRFELDPLPPVTVGAAATASAAYPGHRTHPFAHCFTCGTARDEGDGLRIFTGPVEPGSSTTTAPWVPTASQAVDGVVPVPVVWAAIDCAGGWAVDFTVHPTVLGRMTGEVLRVPAVGEPCVVTGHLDGREGRKFRTRTALHAGDELLARSEQTWIEIDPSHF